MAIKRITSEWNYKVLGIYDGIDHLKELVSRITPEEWQENTERQRTHKIHQETENIVFFQPFPASLPDWAKRSQGSDEIAEEVLKIAKIISDANNDDYFVRASLVKVPPEAGVPEHVDAGVLLTLGKRFHVSVFSAGTNTNGGEVKRYVDGEIVEINNLKIHSSHNDTDRDRILLIMDFVPKASAEFVIENYKKSEKPLFEEEFEAVGY